ncbi:hypothetical protein N9K35_01645 [Pseudomonadales bacterium]|nr:hypothetical protein [Pseudomonadales bacterium]
MIIQTKSQAQDTRTLRHMTRAHYLDSIFEHGIQREGYNLRRIGAESRILKKQYERVGRYVWLTKSDDGVRCINAITKSEHNKMVALEIYDKELKIISWKILKSRLLKKRKSRAIIEQLEFKASMLGDNTDDWFVCETEIPVENISDVRFSKAVNAWMKAESARDERRSDSADNEEFKMKEAA